MKDIFISHASEDKQSIVEPLVKTLESNNISCWYDKNDIGWGDSIVGKINDGLESSKYVVFIISQTFLDKKWTTIELNTTLNMQISSGEKKVLPILVDNVQSYQLPPLLRDKKYIEWNHQQEIVDELKKILGKNQDIQLSSNNSFSIPMPKKVRKITQLDKDRFTKEVYQGIVKYFEQGLAQLQTYHDGVDVELTKVNELKFVTQIYVDGESKSQCKIWMGGTFAITYAHGYMSMSNDSSFHDWLFLEEDENGLYMKGSAMNIMQNSDKKLRNGQEAGEYFWKSFIEPLER
jgi:hypothetical protein